MIKTNILTKIHDDYIDKKTMMCALWTIKYRSSNMDECVQELRCMHVPSVMSQAQRERNERETSNKL